jgi:hypothetical protein
MTIKKMIVSILTIKGIVTVELKHNDNYAIVKGKAKGFPFKLIIKGLIKLHRNKKAKQDELRLENSFHKNKP